MSSLDLLKGIGIGLVAGGAITMAVGSGKRKKRKNKHHTIRAIGDVVDNVTDMIF